ncbi:unnamed protein product [Durusdinium trenchii]|uniref:Uncharacterized protein n=2 Tax=Durusdinium trenchii TaxID=1381693 RepID=A0ABP0PN67_9DINO
MRPCRRLLASVSDHVWRFGAGRPRVAVLGGVHGNELAGVEVVRTLVQELSQAPQTAGEVTLIIGNPPAVAQATRYIEEDLNRCFDDVFPAKNLEQRRAKEISAHLKGLDLLLDLHATNKPSEPFARLPGGTSGRRRRFQAAEQLFLQWLPESCQKVLWDPQGLIAGGAMTDEFALRHGPRGATGPVAQICYEAGLASDASVATALLMAVRAALTVVGAVEATHPCADPLVSERKSTRAWEHYEITEIFRLDRRGFRWLPPYGAYNFQPVPSGAAYSARGESEGELLVTREPSYLVFPKVPELWADGKPLGWLARRLNSL